MKRRKTASYDKGKDSHFAVPVAGDSEFKLRIYQICGELIPLTTAYLRKGILYILILFWSVLLFKEHVTVNNIIGSIIIIAGISLHGMDEH